MHSKVAQFLARALVATWLSSNSAAQDNLGIELVDATAASQIRFLHDDGADLEGYLVSLMGSGLGSFDFDNDGLIDIYFLNGTPIRSTGTVRNDHLDSGTSKTASTNALYRNLGNAKFSDSSTAARVALTEYGLGTAMADFDNDGFVDIAISNYGSISLFRNCGDGTFQDYSSASGISDIDLAFGAGVAFLDFDTDGDVDLFVADYVDFSLERFEQVRQASHPFPPGPEQFEYRSDHLLQNNGDGTFTDISEQAGISQYASPSMGVVCGDFDGDQDTDIFVCSDARPNLMFLNNGDGTFGQEAEIQATAYNASGIPVGSMGAEAADFDNDGWEDLFITDYSAQAPIMFRNNPTFGFEDVTTSTQAGKHVVPHANWGAGLIDFDNDGDRDLLIGNGHLFKWANETEELTEFKMANCLLENIGNGRFKNITTTGGNGLSIVESTRGLVFEDFDNDGDIDCAVLNSDAYANYLENRSKPKGNWVQFRLRGVRFNRDGIGAKVTIWTGDAKQTAEVRSGRGYQSHYGTRLHFGLGKATRINRVEVDWLGRVDVYHDLPAKQLHQLFEESER